MGEAKKGGKLLKHYILEIFSMIRDYLLGEPKMSNDMIVEELGDIVYHVVEHWHDLDPFGEVINDHDYVLVAFIEWGIVHNKVDAPLAKETDSNDKVQRS